MEHLTTRPSFPAEFQDVGSPPDREQCYGERESKRRCLEIATAQDGTAESRFRDARASDRKGSQDGYDRPQDRPTSGQIDSALSATDIVQAKEAFEETLESKLEKLMAEYHKLKRDRERETGFSEEEAHISSPGQGRGRTPERVDHTRYSPRPHAVSRANSTSSVRSMIDERLEWAHQDRMRSASRDRSVPRSPFHEDSPFCAEFARDSGHVSPFDVDKSCATVAANLPHRPKPQSFKCSRINPHTGKPCNAVFSRSYDLTRHDDTIHNNFEMRFLCPHCCERKYFSQKDALIRHMRVVHPEMSTHHWSCAPLANPEDAICHVHHGLSVCAYCGMELQGSPSERSFFEHLLYAHRFRKCDTEIPFFSPDHFRQHLEESHGATSSGEWINIVSHRCFANDHLDQSTMDTDADASRDSFAPEYGTAGLEEPPWQEPGPSGTEHRDPTRSRYMCKCCPGNPKTFGTWYHLRHAVDLKLILCILANYFQDS
jgi:hypothetical protein